MLRERGAWLTHNRVVRLHASLLIVCACAVAGFQQRTPVSRDESDSWTETEIARESFSDARWRDRWVVEGDAELSAKDGRLSVVPQQATLWWREALPTDVVIEMNAGVDGPAENNAANLNLIFHARELDGQPYKFGRSASYDEYQSIPNYIATLTGGFQEGWSRLRRD